MTENQAVGTALMPDETEAAAFLARWGKDRRLVPYGGANYGMPLDLLPPGALVVPNDRFYLRSNGPVPEIDPAAWRLAVLGRVERPLALGLADLAAMPRRTLAAVLECAGNGRTRFDPVPPGTPWVNDAAGNAVWEGVPLAHVLDLAGVAPDAVDLVAQGGDFPEMQRGLPLPVARDPDTLLVVRMNGDPLPVPHGGPVRLLVPGWAGIASTKWLVGLEAIDRAFAGFWNHDNYVVWSEDGTPLRPVAEMPPKSVIARPIDGATLSVGPTEVGGYAWSGYGAIVRVEVSADGGATWADAALRQNGRRAWAAFALTWTPPPAAQAAPITITIMARATDERGLRQPAAAAWNAKGYQMNAIHAVSVRIAG